MQGLIVLIFIVLMIFILVLAGNRKGSQKPIARYREPAKNSRVILDSNTGPSIRITVSPYASSYGQRRHVDPDAVWVPAHRSIEVAGYSIQGGMLYVGDYLQSAGGYADPDPALINPRLDVDRNRLNVGVAAMGYWPSYSHIEPASRAAYLEWLSTGRSDPTAYIGYVYLYFYGLERRALADAVTSVAAQGEIDAIRGEVERLLTIYQGNNSFRRYANDFLEVLCLRESSSRFYEKEPPRERNGYELPISVRVALGQLSAETKPIPPDWAVTWLIFHPEAHLRTPAKRCPDEFRQLFKIHYSRRYGEGILIAPNKTKISYEYRPASASFSRSLKVPLGDIPDVSTLTGPLNKLVEISNQCADELEPFSRYVGRSDADRQGLAAIALLPPALSGLAKSAEVSQLRDWIKGYSKGGDSIEVPAVDLIHQWPGAEGDVLATKESTLLAQLLEKLGYGLEPDPRFGGSALKAGERAVLFSVGSDSPKAPSLQYKASTALLHVGVAVANSDGTVAESERNYLLSYIDAAMHLSDDERKRLHAHLLWLIGSAPGLVGLKRRIDILSPQQKEALAHFILGVVGADGKIEPGEIKVLTKIYPILGIPEDDVYIHLHALMTKPASATEEPVTIQIAHDKTTGFAIPALGEMKRKVAGGVILDMRAVRAKLEATAEVSALLSTIFVEETPSLPLISSEAKGTIGSLDTAHSQLLRTIMSKGEMSRGEYEHLATNLGLLPDGALEEINDAAFEVCDRPVCEGDDPIHVDPEVAREMAA